MEDRLLTVCGNYMRQKANWAEIAYPINHYNAIHIELSHVDPKPTGRCRFVAHRQGFFTSLIQI